MVLIVMRSSFKSGNYFPYYLKKPFLVLQDMATLRHSSIYWECWGQSKRAEGEFICLLMITCHIRDKDKFRYPSTRTPCGLRELVLAFLVEGIPGYWDSSVSPDIFKA